MSLLVGEDKETSTDGEIRYKYFREKTFDKLKESYTKWLLNEEPVKILRLIPIYSYYDVGFKITYIKRNK